MEYRTQSGRPKSRMGFLPQAQKSFPRMKNTRKSTAQGQIPQETGDTRPAFSAFTGVRRLTHTRTSTATATTGIAGRSPGHRMSWK